MSGNEFTQPLFDFGQKIEELKKNVGGDGDSANAGASNEPLGFLDVDGADFYTFNGEPGETLRFGRQSTNDIVFPGCSRHVSANCGLIEMAEKGSNYIFVAKTSQCTAPMSLRPKAGTSWTHLKVNRFYQLFVGDSLRIADLDLRVTTSSNAAAVLELDEGSTEGLQDVSVVDDQSSAKRSPMDVKANLPKAEVNADAEDDEDASSESTDIGAIDPVNPHDVDSKGAEAASMRTQEDEEAQSSSTKLKAEEAAAVIDEFRANFASNMSPVFSPERGETGTRSPALTSPSRYTGHKGANEDQEDEPVKSPESTEKQAKEEDAETSAKSTAKSEENHPSTSEIEEAVDDAETSKLPECAEEAVDTACDAVADTDDETTVASETVEEIKEQQSPVIAEAETEAETTADERMEDVAEEEPEEQPMKQDEPAPEESAEENADGQEQPVPNKEEVCKPSDDESKPIIEAEAKVEEPNADIAPSSDVEMEDLEANVTDTPPKDSDDEEVPETPEKNPTTSISRSPKPPTPSKEPAAEIASPPETKAEPAKPSRKRASSSRTRSASTATLETGKVVHAKKRARIEPQTPAESSAESAASLRSRSSAGHHLRVCITGLTGDFDRLATQLRALDVAVTDRLSADEPVDIVVSSKLNRTIKILCALAMNTPIVSSQWVADSAAHGRLLLDAETPANPESKYLISDRTNLVKQYKMPYAEMRTLRETAGAVFAAKLFAIDASVEKPSPKDLQMVIEAAGGQVVPVKSVANDRGFLMSAAGPCNVDWLTECIVRSQVMPVEDAKPAAGRGRGRGRR